jgi:UDP-hydrolysing UDP-N-acetyl-D-glucosamine 2-epimerase
LIFPPGTDPMHANTTPRRVAVVTGSRADYGLLRAMMKALVGSPNVALDVLVTGMHLAPQFGETWKAIEADGFSIAARVDIGLSSDSPLAIARSTGNGVIGFADALSAVAPDLVVILGDRYEVFAAATAALLLGIPIAHIHGGEVTEGAFDDAIRHAISKMAHLHFAAAERYRQRLIQMGESPDRVFDVGAPGLDHLTGQPVADRAAVLSVLGMEGLGRYFLVTLHPETMNHLANRPMADATLAALDAFPQYGLVFTGVNADPGNREIDDAIKAYVAAQGDRARLTTSLGSDLYGKALQHASAVIGNSSSGIIEAPATGTPTVNIGNRQKGRLRAASIIDCPADRTRIEGAIEQAISQGFRSAFSGTVPPYGQGGASAKIAEIISTVDLATLGAKGFHDL